MARKRSDKDNISTLNLNGSVDKPDAAAENLNINKFICELAVYDTPVISNLIFFNPLAQCGEISAKLKNKGGVYCWINKLNGKKYIGSGVNLYRRLSDYFYVSYLFKGEKLCYSKSPSKIWHGEFCAYCFRGSSPRKINFLRAKLNE